MEIVKLGEREFRGEIVNGETWFVGKDVAEMLGYKNTQAALYRHVDDCDKMMSRGCDSSGRTVQMIFINEMGVYNLIFRSQLPEAKEFRRWVTKEVLPSIFRTGTYTTTMPRLLGAKGHKYEIL